MRLTSDLRQRIQDARVSDIPALWAELNSSPDVTGAQVPQQHIRQHASRAAKWIAVALTPSLITKGARPDSARVMSRQQELHLGEAMALDPSELGRRARAAYLVTYLGVAQERAHESSDALGLGKDRRKINNVSESVRKCVKFFAPYFSARVDGKDSLWPNAACAGKNRAGLRLYRLIRDMHIVRGIADPASFKPEYVREVAESVSSRFMEVRKAGDYNKMLRELRALLSGGHLAPLDLTLVEGLLEVRMSPDRGNARAFSDEDLIARWPSAFPADPSETDRVDRLRGVLGYFNKGAGLQRPANPEGAMCPRENRLGFHGVEGRLASIKRYLRRIVDHFGEAATSELKACFCREAIEWWLPSYLGERDVITSMHRDEFLEVTNTAKLYCGLDVTPIMQLAEEIDFPRVGESMKGSDVVRSAGSPLALLKWAEAFDGYAADAPLPTVTNPSGLYFPRKCLQLDVLLRTETGLRPDILDSLEVRAVAPPPGHASSVIWWDEQAQYYRIRVPRDCMKQHKRSYASTSTAGSVRRGARRPYDFIVWRQQTIHALHEYLSRWSIARGVAAGTTSSLYLSREGKAYKRGGFCNSYISKKHFAARDWERRTGEKLPLLDRYAHRHLMGEFLGRHIPGGNLKAWYLTHRSDSGSDRNYGDDDAALLRECIDEILSGRPPRPAQEKDRWAQQTEQLDEVQASLNSLNEQLSGTNEALLKANAKIAERDRIISDLRRQIER